MEQQLLVRVFRDDSLELARQFQYKAMLQRLGGISDLAEDVADDTADCYQTDGLIHYQTELGGSGS